MPVKFKIQGISEYKNKFKGRRARSRSASPQLRMRQAGLRSDQLGISREPQFLSKRRVPFTRPQVSQSFQWEEPAELPQEHQAPRPSTPPAAPPHVEEPGNAEGAETLLAPRGPRPSGALCTESERVAPVEEAGPALNGVHHVLKRRAGLKSAARTRGLQSSEYQRQFMRKTPIVSSPLLAAEQLVYSSSPVIPPFKVNPVVQESEYRRSFKGSPPPRAPRLRRDVEQREDALFQLERPSPERAVKSKKKKKKQLSRKPSVQYSPPQCGLQSQQQEVRSQSPQEPLPSHGGYRKVKSEYSSHFRSPLLYRFKEGAWVKSSTAGEEGCESHMWHREVRELREKAEAYRRRAWGTHFSRDHLNQIMSEQNCLWEASTASSSIAIERSSASSSIQALDLASGESVKGSPSEGEGSPPGPHPVRRKLAWGEEEPGAGPEQVGGDKREKQDEEPHGGEQEEEEEERNDRVAAPEDQHRLEASVSQTSGLGGRLATPKMKTIATIQRTHHDLTTPTTGGAILVSPPKSKGPSQGRSVRRCEPPLGKPHSPYKSLSRTSPEWVSTKVEDKSLPHSSPTAGLTTVDPIPLREDTWPTQPSPEKDPPAPCPARTSHRHSSVAPHLPIPVLINRIHGTLRDPEFQHNGNLGFIRQGTAAFPLSDSDLSDNDDRMSQISARSAASCAMASQVLERAQKRQKDFWGKS
ncbi:hypothetical protein AAFF_G00369220 [Aldrovandia affinis]|uniref:Nuclear protein MDM1 n=1 Tax=Aldrovandia affinis TaxID=143900 RepID=A0AAD7WMQ6_9TELE|nr:hypothetical protein AAFF_G00369220 [Aldrovandia affinis]